MTANTEAHRIQAVTTTQHKDRHDLPFVTKVNHNRVCTTLAAQQAAHIPRMEAPIPRVKTPIPGVTANTEAHRIQVVTTTQHKLRHNLPIVTNLPVPLQK